MLVTIVCFGEFTIDFPSQYVSAKSHRKLTTCKRGKARRELDAWGLRTAFRYSALRVPDYQLASNASVRSQFVTRPLLPYRVLMAASFSSLPSNQQRFSFLIVLSGLLRRLYQLVVHQHGTITALVAEIKGVLLVGVVALIALHDDLAALAPRAPEPPPRSEAREHSSQARNARYEEKVENIVGDASDPKRRPIQLREDETQYQQDQRDYDLRVVFVKVVFKLPELDFHG